jgi:hypothetical protein
MKAIMTGTISAGFGVERLLDDRAAPAAVAFHLAAGLLAEAVTVHSPKELDKREPKPDSTGTVIVGFFAGVSGGCTLFGPFGSMDIAEEFAENHRDDCEEWAVFVIGASA